MAVNIGSVIPIAATSETQTFPDDVALKFGTGGTASMLYETKDANANKLTLALPDGGATDVPVLAIGDQSIVDKDLTLFNGVTVPSLAIFDASEAHYLAIDGSGTIASDTTITFSPSGQAATLTMTADGTVTSLIPATGDYLRIGDAGTTSHTLAANDDLLVSGKLEVDGVFWGDGGFYLTEMSAALGDTAGLGQIWVKNTTPNQLWFTDDAGTDFQIGSGSGTGLTWSEVTGTSQAAAINSGYIANNEALVTVTLPATAAVGSLVEVVGSGSGLWKLAAAAGDTIKFGNATTAAAGSLTATLQYDTVRVVCITADTTWVVTNSVGSLTVA